MTIKVIEQEYAGIKFRSSLEARWAVFFDAVIGRNGWSYESEGYVINGRPYRPDFRLKSCGTWVEVKGDPERLDVARMVDAAAELPLLKSEAERGPSLMILGDIPDPGSAGDWGWMGLHPETYDGETEVFASYYGFGMYWKRKRPWWLREVGLAAFLSPQFMMEPAFFEHESGVSEAYQAARSYRFGRR